MLRALASATGYALRSVEASSSRSLLASSSSLLESSSSNVDAASRVARTALASTSSTFSSLFSTSSRAGAGLADFIETPLKEGEKRVAGEEFFFAF